MSEPFKFNIPDECTVISIKALDSLRAQLAEAKATIDSQKHTLLLASFERERLLLARRNPQPETVEL